MYKAIVTFSKKTEAFDTEVKQELKHVDKAHAEKWVKGMGDKIWNVQIKEL